MFFKKKKTSPEMRWGKKVSDVYKLIENCDSVFSQMDNGTTRLDILTELYKDIISVDMINNFIRRTVNQKKQDLLYELKQMKEV